MGELGRAGRRQRSCGSGNIPTGTRLLAVCCCLLPTCPPQLPSAHREVAPAVIFLHCQIKQLLDCVKKGLAGAQVLSTSRD